MSGALRSGVHAEHQRRSGGYQVDRALHHRQGLGRGLGAAAAARSANRQARCGRRFGPGGHGMRAAAGARGAPGRCCSRRATASVACCATASPTSRWRSTLSTGASSRWLPKASNSASIQHVGVNVPVLGLVNEFDAVALTIGSEEPRDLAVPGRDLDGVHFAMDFLPLQNRRVAGDTGVAPLTASGKHVVVIGGGDTGSDCVGTSNRQGAAVGDPVRTAGAAARAREQAPGMALLADEAAHVFVARGRLRTRLGGADESVQGRERASSRRSSHAASSGRTASSSRYRAANSRSRPTSCCWRWAMCTRCIAACSTSLA